MIGVLSGAADLNPMLILGKRASIQGISVGSTQMFEAMNRAISVATMKPIIDKVFAFDETPAAFRAPAVGAAFWQDRGCAGLTGKYRTDFERTGRRLLMACGGGAVAKT